MEIITEPGTTLFLLILVIGGLVFYYLKLKYLQDLAKIEHGLVSSPKDGNYLKKLGVIFISIGIGILSGHLFGKFTGIHPMVTIPSTIFVFGGASLLIVNQIK